MGTQVVVFAGWGGNVTPDVYDMGQEMLAILQSTKSISIVSTDKYAM
jgi:hypothetical protein